MHGRFIRMALTLAGAVAVAVALVGCGADKPNLDKPSYQAGYNAFGGAYLPPSDEGRAAVEARCEEMWPASSRASDSSGLKKADWVAGCADAAEGKESRFGGK